MSLVRRQVDTGANLVKKEETHEVLWKAHSLLSNIDYLARKYETISIIRELESGDVLGELERAMEAYDEEVNQ